MASSQVPPATVRFGVFEADLRAGELRRNGIKVRLQDLPFRALTLLLSRPGSVITRDEFRLALWPADVFVDFEQGISSAIMRLRDALGDSADNPIFIETIERRGYRWIAPVPLASVSSAQGRAVQDSVVPAAETPARSDDDFSANPLSESGSLSQGIAIAPHSARWKSIAWKAIYLVPLLLLLFAVWSLRPSSRSAKAGIGSKRPGLSAPASIPPAGTHPANTHPVNQEAKDLYLQGRFYWNKRTPESLTQAVDAFTQAIVHDPGYSDAYVGLADCYNLLREFSRMPASEAYPRALAAAKKAVELDDQSSEAHASLAFVSVWGMWDTATADKEFRRAIDLDPNNANAHHWYATYLNNMRRFDEALRQIDRAQALDPNSSSILADKGRLLWLAGRRAESLQLLKQVESAEPNFFSPHVYLKNAYLDLGDYPAYLAEAKKEALIRHDPAALSAVEAGEKGFAAGGATGMFTGQLQQQKKLFDEGKLSPFDLAQTEGRLGNTQKALQYLQVCYDRHDELTLNVSVDPAFDTLRGDPAFQQLLVRIGLPQGR